MPRLEDTRWSALTRALPRNYHVPQGAMIRLETAGYPMRLFLTGKDSPTGLTSTVFLVRPTVAGSQEPLFIGSSPSLMSLVDFIERTKLNSKTIYVRKSYPILYTGL